MESQCYKVVSPQNSFQTPNLKNSGIVWCWDVFMKKRVSVDSHFVFLFPFLCEGVTRFSVTWCKFAFSTLWSYLGVLKTTQEFTTEIIHIFWNPKKGAHKRFGMYMLNWGGRGAT